MKHARIFILTALAIPMVSLAIETPAAEETATAVTAIAAPTGQTVVLQNEQPAPGTRRRVRRRTRRRVKRREERKDAGFYAQLNGTAHASVGTITFI